MILVGGVGQLWQGDLDLGRRAVGRLEELAEGKGVVVEDLSYGAVAVAQRLEELRPDGLILVGAHRRGRRAGVTETRRHVPKCLPPEQVQGAVADAVTGYVSLDLVLEVAEAFGVLPADTLVVDVEPAVTAPCSVLSPQAEAGLASALAAVRAALGERGCPATGGGQPKTDQTTTLLTGG